MHQVIDTDAISDRIIKKLQNNLNVIDLELNDISHLHSNHNKSAIKGNTHFSLFIVAQNFENINLLARHRLINKVLEEELKVIHALSIKALDGKEHLKRNAGQRTCI